MVNRSIAASVHFASSPHCLLPSAPRMGTLGSPGRRASTISCVVSGRTLPTGWGSHVVISLPACFQNVILPAWAAQGRVLDSVRSASPATRKRAASAQVSGRICVQLGGGNLPRGHARWWGRDPGLQTPILTRPWGWGPSKGLQAPSGHPPRQSSPAGTRVENHRAPALTFAWTISSSRPRRPGSGAPVKSSPLSPFSNGMVPSLRFLCVRESRRVNPSIPDVHVC